MRHWRKYPKSLVAATASVLWASFSLPVVAADLFSLPLESLLQVEYEVSSASKFTQVASRAPTAVQVIDAEAIRRHGWRNLGEMLNSLPGMLIGSDRCYDYFGVRGFQQTKEFNHRFLLAIDGQRINDPVYEQAMIGDEFPLDVSLIERVEYVEGPGSSIYGANAIFGVVNVITRRADRVSTGANVAWSSNGWRTANGSAATRLENESSLTFAATVGDKSGQDVSYSAPPGYLTLANGTALTSGVARGLDNASLARLFVRWETDDTDLTVLHGTRRNHPSAPLYGSVLNDSSLYLEDTSSRLSLSGKRELAESLLFQGHIAYNRLSFTGTYPYFDPLVGYFVNHDQTEARWWSGESYLVYDGLEHHKWVTGVELQHESKALQQSANVTAATVTPLLNTDTASRTAGVYVQDEWTFAEGWLANLGARYDQHSKYGGSTNPRAALVWQPRTGSTLKLLYGRAYRTPTDYEAFYTMGAATPLNPLLQSEAIRTWQLVAEQQVDERTQLSATLFRYNIDHLIAQVAVAPGIYQYQNAATITAQGGDVALKHRSVNGLRVDASLAVQNVADAAGRRYDNSPRWSTKLNASYPLMGEVLLLAGELRVVGRRSFIWTDGVSRTLPTAPLLDVALTTPHLGGGLSAQFRLTNVFNRHSFVAAGQGTMVPLIPIYGRTAWLGVSYAY